MLEHERRASRASGALVLRLAWRAIRWRAAASVTVFIVAVIAIFAAATGRLMCLGPGSASTVFTVARIVGLIAHALEEYPHRLRFRPRATYAGPAPR